MDKPVDLVLFHTVLEWVAEPEKVLKALFDLLRPGGVTSLMFYNLHGLTLRTLTLGNFGYLRTKRKKCTLSPDYPCNPDQVYRWLEACVFVIEQRAGIQVFSDYMRPPKGEPKSDDEIIEMERRYCR